jgi:hypothetical protein
MIFLALVSVAPLLFLHVSAEEELGIVSYSDWMDPSLIYHVVGEIENTSDKTLSLVNVKAILFDGNNKVLAEETSLALLDNIQPGFTAPFDIIFSDMEIIKETKYYAIEVVDYDNDIAKPVTLEIVDDETERNELGLVEVKGKLYNKGSQEARNAKIIATFYGPDRKVIGAGAAYVDKDSIIPNEYSDFSFSIRVPPIENDPDYINVEFMAESDEYVTVPEFSSVIMPVLAAGLLFFIIQSRRFSIG